MSTATRSKPKLRITPLEDRVVVAPDDEAETMRGGLLSPTPPRKSPPRAASSRWARGGLKRAPASPMDVKVGDKVLYGKYSGTEITLEGEEVMIIKASDILAKLG